MANTHIVTFIQHLSDPEIRIAEDYLEKSRGLFAESNADSKELQLFRLIISSRPVTITDQEILRAIPVKDLSHLKSNLYDKVLEALIFDKHLSNTAIFGEFDSVALGLKKKMLIFKSNLRTINQGKTEALKELLEDIIATATEYELYDTLVEALTSKKYMISIRMGQVEFDRISKEIEFYSECVRALYYATDCYYKIIINNDLIKSFTEKELDRHIRSSIKQIESDYKKTRSVQINYYLHILQFAFNERQKKYKTAIELCENLVDLLKHNKSIYRKERLGNALCNLSQFKTLTGQYVSAAKDARKARDHYPENSFDYNIATEQEFHCYFYDGEYDKAETCVNVLLGQLTEDAGQFRKSKFIYYKASILFATGRFKEALHLLNESLEIEKDKSRWNVALRILQIQLFIELHKISEAGNALESLRKYMERTGKNEEIKERNENIVRLLREMEKNGFQYDDSNKTAASLLEQLSDKKGGLAWEHYTPELIPFHEWVVKGMIRDQVIK